MKGDDSMKGWLGGGPVTTVLIQLTELLVRMEKSLELLESSWVPPSLVSHRKGQLLS